MFTVSSVHMCSFPLCVCVLEYVAMTIRRLNQGWQSVPRARAPRTPRARGIDRGAPLRWPCAPGKWPPELDRSWREILKRATRTRIFSRVYCIANRIFLLEIFLEQSLTVCQPFCALNALTAFGKCQPSLFVKTDPPTES